MEFQARVLVLLERSLSFPGRQVYVQYLCIDLLESVYTHSKLSFRSLSASRPSHLNLMNPFQLLTNLANHDLSGASSISLIKSS